jgi:hypothetical protein
LVAPICWLCLRRLNYRLERGWLADCVPFLPKWCVPQLPADDIMPLIISATLWIAPLFR